MKIARGFTEEMHPGQDAWMRRIKQKLGNQIWSAQSPTAHGNAAPGAVSSRQIAAKIHVRKLTDGEAID